VDKNIEEGYKFLIEGCGISSNLLDMKGNCSDNWERESKNGPTNYLKQYIPPNGWTGIGLKVAYSYDNGNNDWLEKYKGKGARYKCYHGVKTIEAIKGICKEGFRRGPQQAFKNADNHNRLTNNTNPKCGEGVYFSYQIKVAEKYTEPIHYKGNKYKVVFMCKVNPFKVRIVYPNKNKEYWVVNGDELGNIYGHNRSDQVRAYRILIKKK